MSLQAAVRGIIGVCFRLLGTSRNSDSVVSTAAATVRQVVALVFQHVSTGSNGGSATSVTSQQPVDDSNPLGLCSGASMSSLSLLDDLCSMATGAWMRTCYVHIRVFWATLSSVLAIHGRR